MSPLFVLLLLLLVSLLPLVPPLLLMPPPVHITTVVTVIVQYCLTFVELLNHEHEVDRLLGHRAMHPPTTVVACFLARIIQYVKSHSVNEIATARLAETTWLLPSIGTNEKHA